MSNNKGEGGLFLGDSEDMLERVANRFLSKDWYVFVSGFGESYSIYSKIEYTYYTPHTPANADFELIIAAPEFIVAMAKKSRMNREQLKGILSECAVDHEIVKTIARDTSMGNQKDLILLAFRNDNQGWMSFIKQFNEYLYRRHPEVD